MEHRIGLVAEAYTHGPGARAAALVGVPDGGRARRHACLARRSRRPPWRRGSRWLAGSALQRFGVFEAGVASTRDPRYVVTPQRERLAAAEVPTRR